MLIDTSVWIEHLTGSDLGRSLRGSFPPPDRIIMPTIVQLELAKWLTRELGEDAADRMLAFSSTCQVVSLTTEIALLAAAQCRNHKLATADAIIYATARIKGAQLLTCDAHFDGLDHVRYEAKT